jgi:hypothetical protein
MNRVEGNVHQPAPWLAQHTETTGPVPSGETVTRTQALFHFCHISPGFSPSSAQKASCAHETRIKPIDGEPIILTQSQAKCSHVAGVHTQCRPGCVGLQHGCSFVKQPDGLASRVKRRALTSRPSQRAASNRNTHIANDKTKPCRIWLDRGLPTGGRHKMGTDGWLYSNGSLHQTRRGSKMLLHPSKYIHVHRRICEITQRQPNRGSFATMKRGRCLGERDDRHV